MEKFQKQNEISFSILTSLSSEQYKKAEIMYQNDKKKNCSIYHKNKLINKLEFIYEHDEESSNLFHKENNFILEIPETLNIDLIPVMTHYFYFKEVKDISFKEIVDFLDLAIFFKTNELHEKIIKFLKESIESARKAVFLRIGLNSIMKRTTIQAREFLKIKELLARCEIFLLANNHIKKFLTFYENQNQCSFIDHDSLHNMESELLNGLEMMKKYKINGKYMLKLLLLFKDRLCVSNKFNFQVFAEEIIHKYVKLEDIDNNSLIKLFARLGLNINDFKIQIKNEKIDKLENEIKNLNKIFQQHSESEIKNGLSHNQNEAKARKRSLRNNIVFLIGATIICLIFMLANQDDEQNILGLKRFYEKKPLLHKKGNENSLEDIKSKLDFLSNFVQKEQKDYEQKKSKLQKERQEQFEKVRTKLELLSNLIDKEQKEKGETWKKENEKELEELKKKLEDISKMIRENEQKEKGQNEKSEKIENKQEEWKKNVQICLKEHRPALECLEKREEEDAAFVLLKSTVKTIHEDHEKHFKYIGELLSLKTFHQLNSTLRLLFRASEYEWPLADKFHELCDGKGPTITIVRSESKKLFGGYASVSWNSNGWSSAPGSFIFSLDNQTNHTIQKNEDLALRGDAQYGPSFGGGDIVLSYKGSNLFNPTIPNWSDLGFTYSLPVGISFQSSAARSYFAGSYQFKVDEYEVFGMAKYVESDNPAPDPNVARLKKKIKTINADHEKHFHYLAELFNFTTLEELDSKINLLFRASEYEFSSAKFHEFCDGKGPTITIIRSNNTKLFGGFASISWASSGGYTSAPGSFLFSLDKQTKHSIYRNEDCALQFEEDEGPTFGSGNDIELCYSISCRSDSNLGGTYSLPDGISHNTDAAKSYLAGSFYFRIEEYEVFGVDIN